MHKDIYERLIEVAREGQTTNYAEIAPLANLHMDRQADRTAMGEILGAISTREHDYGRPLLSAVVVLAESGCPGKGFFTLVRELDIYDGADDLVFWVREVKRVYEYWGKVE
jgi:hypothetical protein